MSAEEQDQLELHKAEQLVAETPTIDGIEKVRVELGEDWSGDPAMWLVFSLSPDFEGGREWVRDHFLDYADAIQMKILHSGLKRFPYTRINKAA